jgi:hypothetical protein
MLARSQRWLFGGAAITVLGAMGGLSLLPFRFGLFMWIMGIKIDLGLVIVGVILTTRGARLLLRLRRLDSGTSGKRT